MAAGTLTAERLTQLCLDRIKAYDRAGPKLHAVISLNPKALEVARLESGYRNWAYNGSCCYGVFQIHYGSHKRRLAARGLGLDGLYDPKVNIAIALEIFNEQGWRPWSTS